MREHKIVKKAWGSEEWVENNDLYCGKILIVHRKMWSSDKKFHYHLIKDKTFYVLEGELLLHVKKGTNIKPIVLKEGESYRIKPKVKHRFTSLSEPYCKFMEVSTQHLDEDSIRCDD